MRGSESTKPASQSPGAIKAVGIARSGVTVLSKRPTIKLAKGNTSVDLIANEMLGKVESQT
jgi:hypothetical protein